MSSRIGILGGTFDPVHRGHIRSAEDVAAAFELDKVLLVVAGLPPHKSGRTATPAADRFAMVQLACRESTVTEASDFEVVRDRPSYTVDTLAALARPERELWFIIGIDAWNEVDTWSRPAELLEYANIVVTSRPGENGDRPRPSPPVAASGSACYDPGIDGFRHNNGHILVGHSIDGMAVSSTQIRKLLGEGRDVADLVGDDVAAYIRRRGLYKKAN